MGLKDVIAEDLKAAMRSRNQQRLDTLRMARARMLEAEVALRAEMGRDYQLSDPEAVKTLAAYAKQRRDSIEAYRNAGREDLAAKEEAELAIIQTYLPKQLTEDEVTRLVDEAIATTGASGPKDMGTVMKAVMPNVQGAADGRMVSRVVQERLARSSSGKEGP